MANIEGKNGQKLDYTTEMVVTTKVKVSDGTEFTLTGSYSSSAVQEGYDRAKVVDISPAPAPSPPVTTQPPISVIKDPLPILRYGPEIIGKGLTLDQPKDKRIIIAQGIYPDQYININKPNNVVLEMTGVDLPNSTIDINQATKFEAFGATMRDQGYRCINIGGLSTDIHLHDLFFKNIGNYAIHNRNEAYWNGGKNQTAKNWTLDRLTFDNTSTCFQSDSDFDNKGVRNLMENFVLSNSIFKNMPHVGNAISIGACDGYDVFGNSINNINTLNNNDNGWAKIIGSGSCHDNRITNHQGYLIRAWVMSFGPNMKTVKLYNNYGYKSRKYSLLEVQTIDKFRDFVKAYPRLASFANCEVDSNIAVSMANQMKDWAGNVLVVYNTYGKVSFTNNIGADNFSPGQDVSKLWFGQNDPVLTPVSASGNTYYPTTAALLQKVPTLKSLLA